MGGAGRIPAYAGITFHDIISSKMRNFLRTTAFILIIIGTAGLLLNELVWEHSTTRTIIFGVVDFVGLVNLGFASFGMKKSQGGQA